MKKSIQNKIKNRLLPLVLGLLTMAGVSGCSFALDEGTLTEVWIVGGPYSTTVGGTFQAYGTGYVEGGTNIEITNDPAAIWESMDTGVLRHEGGGVFRGISFGGANITLTYMGFSTMDYGQVY